MTRIALTRAQLLAYRSLVHDLAAAGDATTVLDVGLQDYPAGRTALLALRLRTGSAADVAGTALVHSVRGALHLHRASDVPLLAAALRHAQGSDLAKSSIGPFGAELANAGIGFDTAMDQVATAMAEVMADAEPRAKGELSQAVSPMVDPRLTPWCQGCGVYHVQDALFRYATLQAGLTIQVESRGLFRYQSPTLTMHHRDVGASRAELIRRFLRAFGPATPAHLASWLTVSPAVARRWWDLVAPVLVEVTVDGTPRHAHPSDLDLLEKTRVHSSPRLLPPYDPLTELADRQLLLPAPAQRRQVWTAAANPGVLLVDNEIVGTWRQRTTGSRLALTVTPLRGSTPPTSVLELEADAHTIANYCGASHHSITFVR